MHMSNIILFHFPGTYLQTAKRRLSKQGHDSRSVTRATRSVCQGQLERSINVFSLIRIRTILIKSVLDETLQLSTIAVLVMRYLLDCFAFVAWQPSGPRRRSPGRCNPPFPPPFSESRQPFKKI